MTTTINSQKPSQPELTPGELEDAFLGFAKVVIAELVRIDACDGAGIFSALQAEAQNLHQKGSPRPAEILVALSRFAAVRETVELLQALPDTGHPH